MTIASELRRKCNDSAHHCFGTAYIFEQRARRIRRKLRFLAFLGVATPASVGAIIGTFNLSPEHTKHILVLAAAIGVIHLYFSIWSIVSNWSERLAYYLESKSANYRLATEYSELGGTTITTADDFNTQLKVLDAQSVIRSDLDSRHDISDAEKRLGMRAGLRKYQRPCAGCGIVPKSMKATKCGVCGK